MRFLKLTLLMAVTFAVSAPAVEAASIDIIWQGSGTATTTVSASTTVVGDIVLTPTTPLSGAGSVIELSADSTGGATITGAAQIVIASWIALATPTIGNPHSEDVVAQGDLFGFGTPVAAPTTIGTISVHAGGGGGTVTVSNTGPADDIFSGPFSVVGEYVFNAGTLVVPEPATMSLLGLGLLGLIVVGRPRNR